MKIVEAGLRLHIVNLRHSPVNVYRRDNDIRIICVLAETVSWGDGAEVCCGNDVRCGSNGGPWLMLADISHSADVRPRYLVQCEWLWKYSTSQLYMSSGMSIWQYLFKSVGCLTVSNALLKSKAMTITNWLDVRRLVTVCRTVMRADVVEPGGRKAN